MEGETFLCINPSSFEDTNVWSYRDIQRLCKRVGLVAKGSREDLCYKLEEWHRSRIDEDKSILPLKDSFEENIPMNVIGKLKSSTSANIN